LLIKIGVEMAVGIRQRCSPSRQQNYPVVTHIREIKSRFKADADIFVFTTARKEALGPTLPLILSLQCKFSLVAKHTYFEATYLSTFIAENRNSWSNTSIYPYVFH